MNGLLLIGSVLFWLVTEHQPIEKRANLKKHSLFHCHYAIAAGVAAEILFVTAKRLQRKTRCSFIFFAYAFFGLYFSIKNRKEQPPKLTYIP
jgi:hypothetical protein